MNTVPPTSSKPSTAPSGTDHDALPPGTRFGEFEILRVLGVGGFGIVYLAQDHSLEREVALKEYMPASLAARGQGPQITVRSSSFAETYAIGLRSFVNEARLLARFDHPSLVKVYRFWEDNATAYMVMPFLQGVTLRDTRRGMAHPPDEPWIRSVITPILSALELLHREGVYHRDIAPDNILLPPDGPPVLLDFGAARRVISDRTQSLTAILKPSYAPIEQYAEMVQMRQGPWTDLYALGAVIHYLLFGAPPAPATARAVQDEADHIENRIVPGVSPRFLEAVSWMLSIRPNQRPQNGEELRAVLDGRAEIPPRGRPGITIPGAVAPAVSAAAPAFEPTRHVEQGVHESRLKTSYVPTHLPTAPSMPPTRQGAAAFNPKTEMPTARVPPSQFDAPVAPPMPSAARTAPPPRTTMPPPATMPPRQGDRGQAASTTQTGPASQWPASRPATLPPPLPGQPRPATMPPPVRPAGPGASSTRPVPLAAAAAAAAPKSSKTVMAVVAGAVAAVAVVVLAIAGWQWSSRRDAASASAAASAATAAPGTGVAATPPPPAAAVATVPAPAPAVLPTPATSLAPATAPAVVAATVAPSIATTASRPTAITAPPLTLPVTVATPSASRLGASAAGTSVAAIGSDASRLAAERARSASAAGGDARARPPGRPVPRVDGDPATASTGNALQRPGDSTGSGNPAYGPANNSPAALAERARAAAAARDVAIATQRPVPVVEVGPSSAREACGRRVFISLAICMDEKCEEARFRSTPECIGILARKQSRENQ